MELIYGDKSKMSTVTVGLYGENQYVLLIRKNINALIDREYELSVIPARSSATALHIYTFASPVSLENVMKYIGFDYVSGVSCLDGVFITSRDIKKPLEDIVRNKCYYHALINCEK